MVLLLSALIAALVVGLIGDVATAGLRDRRRRARLASSIARLEVETGLAEPPRLLRGGMRSAKAAAEAWARHDPARTWQAGIAQAVASLPPRDGFTTNQDRANALALYLQGLKGTLGA